MRPVLFSIALALTISMISSCQTNCCTYGVNKVCEGDDHTGAGFSSWEEHRAYLKNLGYQCD